MNPFDPDIFAADIGCLPCCGGAPAECACALLIPPLGAPVFSDYSTAETHVTDFVADCIAWTPNPALFGFDPPSAFTADNSTANTLLSTLSRTSQPTQLQIWSSISVADLTNLSLVWSATTDGTDPTAEAFLYECGTWTLVQSDSDTGSTGTLTLTSIPEGEYVLAVFFTSTGPISASVDWTITADDTMIVNPVIALWDDSGTTRKLWACPKLLLPPLTESTGDWYADCAAADAVFTDPLQVSNCVGFLNNPAPNLDTFTATGGSSLTLAETLTSPNSGSSSMWGSINLEAGETVSVNLTQDGGTPDLSCLLYDDSGVLVEDFSAAGSSTATSSPVPYTGRYTIAVGMSLPPPNTPANFSSFAITSSGIMSVNPIQARYDLGLTCAGTLDCGDACP